MTVSTNVHSFDYSGNGTTTIFVVPFPYKAQSHVVVKLIDNITLAETPWTLGVDYTLTGGDPTGTLTASVAPASGTTLHGERIVPTLQSLDLNANDAFPASAMEDALDLLTMMIQQGIVSGGGGGGGSSITLANIGTGEGVIAGLVGDQYQLKSLKVAGSGLSIASDTNSITATLAGVLLVANDLSDVANRQTALNGLTAVSGATNEFVLTKDTGTGNALWKAVPTGGGGEANTSSSAGGTVALALAKVGVNLPFRGLTAGANITLTPSATDVTIAGTGEANTISTVAATGSSIIPATSKVGVDLKTKGIGATAPMLLSSSATDLTIALDLAASITWTGVHKFNGATAEVDISGADYVLGGGVTGNRVKISRQDPGTRVDDKVEAGLVVSSKVTGGSSVNYAEWNALFTMEDRSNKPSNELMSGNVPLATVGLKYGTSTIWGAAFLASNKGGSLSGNIYGIESAIRSDGDGSANFRTPGAFFYGSETAASSKQYAGILIRPFDNTRDALKYGVILAGGADTLGNGAVMDEGFVCSAIVGSAVSVYGTASDAVVNLDGCSASVAIDMRQGSRLKFRSGTDSGRQTWWPGGFSASSWDGELEMLVDGTKVYVPIRLSHH